jgi:hypothetical protein
MGGCRHVPVGMGLYEGPARRHEMMAVGVVWPLSAADGRTQGGEDLVTAAEHPAT